MFVVKLAFCFLFHLVLTEAEERKWIWGDSHRNENRPNPRYEVVENEGYPPAGGPRPFYPSAPYPPPNRPLFSPNQPRPAGGYGQGGYSPGGFRPGVNPGILTGPVPSWEQQKPHLLNFDKCKCAEKFNCNSPGISYGQCDVGKQYCCYVSNPQNGIISPAPSRPVHSAQNGILVGPGGPYDYPKPAQNIRPDDGYYGEDGNGLLVGPGGPTGIIGRPPAYTQERPVYSTQNGVLVGPGGPWDRPLRPPGISEQGYDAFARSAKQSSRSSS